MVRGTSGGNVIMDTLSKSKGYDSCESYPFAIWDRIYRNFKSYVLINFLSIIINTIILHFSNINGDNKVLLYGSILAPLVGLLLSELLIGMRVRRRVDRERLTLLPRDLRFEHKTYSILVAISSCAYAIILVVFGLL